MKKKINKKDELMFRCKRCEVILTKINIKGLPKGMNAFVCPRCWDVSFKLTPQFKNQLIKKLAKETERQAIEEIIKEAN